MSVTTGVVTVNPLVPWAEGINDAKTSGPEGRTSTMNSFWENHCIPIKCGLKTHWSKTLLLKMNSSQF